MKSCLSSENFKPFEGLAALIERHAANKTAKAEQATVMSTILHDGNDNLTPKTDRQLFLEAMADVTPISGEKVIGASMDGSLPPLQSQAAGMDELAALNALVSDGQGFNVADTPEYVEGTGYNVHPEIARRLHEGAFSIQAHIDLHGMSVAQAQKALALFFKDAMMTGKKAVLIVHGRGLGSARHPVLKTKVIEWLTCGYWRKWVMAFASARLCDGGAGGTYVLLRERPFTRRYRKRNKGGS